MRYKVNKPIDFGKLDQLITEKCINRSALCRKHGYNSVYLSHLYWKPYISDHMISILESEYNIKYEDYKAHGN